ncbi:MAG TPA: hypothetical protein VFN64_05190 [Burkholderiaceae bacterium]|nr:hypothetical protein [Burkholderiaceae bacterium]
MPILDVEVVGQQPGDVPLERLADRLADAVGSALDVPAGQLWVKLRRLPASQYAENGPPNATLPVFVRVLARLRDPSEWPQRAATIAAVVAKATGRERASVHVIFEADASGRVFFGGAPDLRAR